MQNSMRPNDFELSGSGSFHQLNFRPSSSVRFSELLDGICAHKLLCNSERTNIE
jgi:hypothetical protein